jgi:hypothetical protein
MAKLNNTKERIDNPTPVQIPRNVNTKPPVGNGYPQEAKSSGIVTRGNGAATKGCTARGPLA